MKKLFALFFISAVTFSLYAQTDTACDAQFSFNITGTSVNFTPLILTVSTTSHHYWNFGDGHIASDGSIVHTYSSAGIYLVKHYYYKSENGIAVCIDSIEKRIEISGVICDIHPAFSFETDSTHQGVVHFKNLSTPLTGITAFKWYFGDGTFSDDIDPAHTYTTAGTFKVCLVVQKDDSCKRYYCTDLKVAEIKTPCDLVAYFAWHPDSVSPNTIHFQNFSKPFEAVDSITWSFGDGHYTNEINPAHQYPLPGTYNVCIRVKKHSTPGTVDCVKEFCKQVVVKEMCTLKADFEFEADSSNKRLVYFNSKSTPLTTVLHSLWTFGDGTSSDLLNTHHTYAHEGSYTVCLKISAGTSCYSQVCKTVEIPKTGSCNDLSKFNIKRSTANCYEFKFIPITPDPGSKYAWTFGDGTGSLNTSPSHVYAHEGKYIVFLTVYTSENCAYTSYQVVETGNCTDCSHVWLKFQDKRESYYSNRIYFHASSNAQILSQSWTITKLPFGTSAPITFSQENLVYVFSGAGDYNVCVKVKTAGGCVKEYCQVLHIEIPHSYCTLTAYPDPAMDQVNINVQLTQSAMIHVYVFNSLNVLIRQEEHSGIAGNNKITIGTGSLVPGWYTLKIISGDRVCYSRFQKI
ncbi:MAG: PKD domain-containing protein [Ginsengibacter sp.]